jgi:hypothetical protein
MVQPVIAPPLSVENNKLVNSADTFWSLDEKAV